MNILCPRALVCPADYGNVTAGSFDNPFANLSSEAPDIPYHKAVVTVPVVPLLGWSYYAMACTKLFKSTISQEDADLQAHNAAKLCADNYTDIPGTPGIPGTPPPTVNPGGGGDWPDIPPPNNPPPTTYYNSPQTCTDPCPDGSTSSYTTEAGLFTGSSQLIADMAAMSYACAKAQEHASCTSSLSDIPDFICLGDGQSLLIESTLTGTITWSVASGSLPTGMTLIPLGSDCAISGTPTVPAIYHFTIKATSSSGGTRVKNYDLTVAGITSGSTLPSVSQNIFYSHQITSGGFISPIFTLSGSLPAGLAMDAAGLISGLPTGSVDGWFSVTVTEGAV
jgi:hypothetical protein